MCGLKSGAYRPNRENHEIYRELFKLYMQIHDAFGVPGPGRGLFNVMKHLLAIRDRQRTGR